MSVDLSTRLTQAEEKLRSRLSEQAVNINAMEMYRTLQLLGDAQQTALDNEKLTTRYEELGNELGETRTQLSNLGGELERAKGDHQRRVEGIETALPRMFDLVSKDTREVVNAWCEIAITANSDHDHEWKVMQRLAVPYGMVAPIVRYVFNFLGSPVPTRKQIVAQHEEEAIAAASAKVKEMQASEYPDHEGSMPDEQRDE